MDFNFKLEDKSVCYERLTKWWEKHKAFEGEYIPYESMPHRIFTISNDIRDLYSVAIYISDSNICWIGWITSNPDSAPREKVKALEELYGYISKIMKEHGFDIIISKTKQRGLARALNNNGFINIEPNTNFYIKNI